MCFAVAASYILLCYSISQLNVNKQFSEYHFEGDDDARDFLLGLFVAWLYIRISHRMLVPLSAMERYKYGMYARIFL